MLQFVTVISGIFISCLAGNEETSLTIDNPVLETDI